MAKLSDLSRHLHGHTKAMPEGLLERLHPAEAKHRLQAVHEMTRTADLIPNDLWSRLVDVCVKFSGGVRQAGAVGVVVHVAGDGR
jgi:hypothetical protein